ncbi:hemicentin-1-like [Pectinophora gossypiella]|nr:hemicentin-1-like [Pectinophora gossypiella]
MAPRWIQIWLLSLISVNIVTASSNKQYGSLSFVIDDSASMQNEIEQVKNAVNRIMDIILNKASSQIQDIVLVTFNDPAYLTQLLKKTRDREQLRLALHGIRVHGGGDCPEYSLTGLKMALENTLPNSIIFVFTDASPKDKELTQKVIRLAQSKSSQVIFILTPAPAYCKRYDREDNFRPYTEIAANTFGQVFKLENKNQINDILHFVDTVVAGNKDVITSVTVPPNTQTYIPFAIDDQTEYAIISASGKDVELDIIEGPTRNYEKVVWLKNAKVVKLNNPDPGQYKAIVKGTATTTVMIFGRTDFTFQHGFHENVPTKFNNDRKQPTEGTKYHLLISVNDPTNSVNIQTAEILSTAENVLIPHLNLRRVSENYYATDLFTPPSSTFLIAISGVGKKTGKEIRRIAKTPIESRPPNSDPIISIEEQGSHEYDSELSLTCKVKAYPKPTITWKDSLENVIPSTTNTLSNTQYVSTTKIQHLRKSQTYRCYAENDIGESSKGVDINVKSPLRILDGYTDKGNVNYGTSATLYCNIGSNYAIERTWYQVKGGTRNKIAQSDKYNVNNYELTIKNVNENDEGKYVCVVTLRDDKDMKHEIVKDVKINPVAPVMGEPTKMQVRVKDSTTIKCNIVEAYPKPKVSWQFKKSGTNDVQTIPNPGNNKELVINNADLKDAGNYYCIAENSKGHASQEFTLTVLTAPRVTLQANNLEKSPVNIAYNGDVKLTCVVTSHSTPVIKWRNSKGNEIAADKPVNSKFNEYTSHITQSKILRSERYSCEAVNEIDKTIKQVDVNLISPFQSSSKDNNTVKGVKYGETSVITCDIVSAFPMKFTWVHIVGKPQKTIVIENSEKYVVSKDGKELKIKNIELNSEGQYKCLAELEKDPEMKDSHTVTVKITDLASPEIVKQPSTIRVNVTNDVTLKCKISRGNPKPTIMWSVQKDGNDKYEALVKETKEELIIKKTIYQNTGMYKCVASNVVDKDEQITELIVEGPPVITSDNSITYTALQGDNSLRIPCVAIGYPKPTISWTLGNGTAITENSKLTVDNGDLIINKPTESDTMNYSCNAKNNRGFDSMVFDVYVSMYIDFDKDYGNITYIYMKNGESKDLKCDGRWFQSGTPTEVVGTYSLKNVNVENDGNYTCRSSDKIPPKSHTYVVDVGYQPILDNKDNQTVDWKGENNRLVCTVEMKPDTRTVKIEWLYNGKVTDIKTQTHPILGWGDYSCTISNYHGTVSKHFKVISSGCLIETKPEVGKSPLILTPSGTWPYVKGENKFVYVKHNTKLLLTCHSQANKPNTFENLPEKSHAIVTCDHETSFLINDKPYKISDLQCKSDTTPAVQKTGEQCADTNSEIVKVGYNIPEAKGKFLEVYSLCVDKDRNVPLYTKVTMRRPENSLPLPKITLDKWLKYGSHKENNSDYCSVTSGCCLEDSQLVSTMDVRQGPPQVATLVETSNFVPVWRDCGQDVTWSDLDKSLRSRGFSALSTFEMWSGAEKYVEKNHILVPRYLWKVLKLTARKIYVVVQVNDPSPTDDDILCSEPCEDFIPYNKYTYCCNVPEFKKTFFHNYKMLI